MRASYQLPKFKGKKVCSTWNLGGDTLRSRFINHRRFVSKNVCHGVYYDMTIHERVAARIESLKPGPHRLSLELMYHGMDIYLSKKPDGKKFHDPLAACCAINGDVGRWEWVDLFCQKSKKNSKGGPWGSVKRPEWNANCQIIIGYNHKQFVETLLDEW